MIIGYFKYGTFSYFSNPYSSDVYWASVAHIAKNTLFPSSSDCK